MASQSSVLVTSLLLLIYGVASVWCDCDNATELSIQVDTLLAEYDRETPPASTVYVEFTLEVNYATILEHRSTVRVFGDLKMKWQDPRIRWNASEWGCDNTLTVAERLWLPDVTVLSAGATDDGDVGQRARLSAQGDVAWVSRVDITAPIALDLYHWPHDTQIVALTFGSRTLNSNQLVLTVKEPETTVMVEGGAWSIDAVVGQSSSWQRGAERASAAAWGVALTRRAPAHALAAVVAHLAAAALLAAATLLPPAQRYPLAGCASLVTTLWLVSALGRVSFSSRTPRLVSLQCAQCACGALAAACAALVLRVAALSAAPPNTLRTILSTLSKKCTLMPSNSQESCGWSGSGAWSAAALVLDLCARAALLLTLLILLLLLIF